MQRDRFSAPNEVEKRARVLVIDDQAANIGLLEMVLHGLGLTEIRSLTDSRLAVDALRELKPDLILLDLKMPYLDGFDLLRIFGTIIPKDEYLPILVLTGREVPLAGGR